MEYYLKCGYIQDLFVETRMEDVEEIKKHRFPFVHPDDIDLTDKVHKFSAVVDRNHNLVNSNNFISYSTQDVRLAKK